MIKPSAGGLDLYTALHKWLKKAKLRDGSHSVALMGEGTFYYRGFPLGHMHEKGVQLKYPALVNKDDNHRFGSVDDILAADPKFFIKLRKAFRNAMTIINSVSIKLEDLPNHNSCSGGRQQSATKK